jgi:hypothetical protein
VQSALVEACPDEFGMEQQTTMRDKTWKVSYMRTEPGALALFISRGKTQVADIVVTSENKIIILNGEIYDGTNPNNPKN